MEVTWLGIGFLVGMAIWMPFIIDARIDVKLARVDPWVGRIGQ